MGQSLPTVSSALCALRLRQSLTTAQQTLRNDIAMANKQMGTADAIKAAQTGMLQVFDRTKAFPGAPSPDDCVKLSVRYRNDVNCDPMDVPCAPLDCSPVPAATFQYSEVDVTLDECVFGSLSVNRKMFECSEQEISQELIPLLREQAYKMYENMNLKLAAKLLANAGSPFASTTLTSATPLPLNILFTNPVTGQTQPQPIGFSAIRTQYRNMGISGSPYVIGGSDSLAFYEDIGRLFQGNVEGFDASRYQGLTQFYYDYQMDTPAAAHPVLTFAPGSVELLEWYKYQNGTIGNVTSWGEKIYQPTLKSDELVRMKTDLRAILGKQFEVDLQIHDNVCDEVVTFKMQKRFDLFINPSVCNKTYNGILLWNVTCAPYVFC
jgi:hypothetical protein